MARWINPDVAVPNKLASPFARRYLAVSYIWDFVVAASDKLMTVVSAKGQVILPKAIRQTRNWLAGTRLIVEETTDGILLKAAPVFPPTRPEDVFASLPYQGTPKSVEEMNAAIAEEVKRRHDPDRSILAGG
jgi:AbrB family looped-hinge helix DNA binding protein